MSEFLSNLTNSTVTSGLWYDELINSPLFLFTLSLAAFKVCNLLYRRLNHFPLLHPTMMGAILVAIVLKQLHLNYHEYFAANQLLMFWLGPTTVALAVPLYQQLHLIRKMALPILLTVTSGALFAAGSAIAIGKMLGATNSTLLSLAPKSVTTPIAIALAEEIGGLATLTAGVVTFTAAVSICFAPLVFRLLKITDPKIWGLCLGITAHGIGTAYAFEKNSTAGTFSSLAMCLTAAFSAATIPFIFGWFNLS
jgi:putative effector of murein hydrolase